MVELHVRNGAADVSEDASNAFRSSDVQLNQRVVVRSIVINKAGRWDALAS